MAVDAFLKFEGIDGESKDAKHPNEIEILSWSVGEAIPGTGGGGGGNGKVSFSDFTFSHHVDKASPVLFLHCATGKHIPTGLITVRKAGEKPIEYAKYGFTDVIITKVDGGGQASGDELPTEQVSFNYSKFRVEYTPQKPDGSLDTSIWAEYDLKTNKGSTGSGTPPPDTNA